MRERNFDAGAKNVVAATLFDVEINYPFMDPKSVNNLTTEALERELRSVFPIASNLQDGFTADEASMTLLLDSVGIEAVYSQTGKGDFLASLFRKPRSPAETAADGYLNVGSVVRPNESECAAAARALLKFHLERS